MERTVGSIQAFSLSVWIVFLWGGSLVAQEPSFSLDFCQNLGSEECFKVLFNDFNGDGFKDILTINFQGSSKIWFNRGDSIWTYSGKSFGNGYNHGAAIGDIDGDGDQDLVIVSTMAEDQSYLNNGSGSFTVYQTLGEQLDLTTQCLLGDLDGDGDLDLLTAHTFKPNRVWINDGTGRFTFKNTIGPDASYYMDIADIDHDGDLDIYLEVNDQSDQIWMNDGQGNFSNSGWAVGFVNGNGHGIFCEINGDLYPDLFLPNDQNGGQFLVNEQGKGFAGCGTPFGNGDAAGLLDIDSDGDLDVILSKMDGTTQLFVNYGEFDLRSYGRQFAGEKCWSVTCEDVDDDGDDDLILGNSAFGNATTKLYLNNNSISSVSLFDQQVPFNVTPNPANGYFRITGDLLKQGCYTITMIDIPSGKTCMRKPFHFDGNAAQWMIPAANMRAGTYVLSLFFEGQYIGSQKLVLL